MICARPLKRLRDHLRVVSSPMRIGDLLRASGHPAASGIFHAHGNDVVADVEKFLRVENRLRIPIVRLAQELIVHEEPAIVIATGKAQA